MNLIIKSSQIQTHLIIVTDNLQNKNAWNIIRLVNESFVPVTQQTSVLYCRVSVSELASGPKGQLPFHKYQVCSLTFYYQISIIEYHSLDFFFFLHGVNCLNFICFCCFEAPEFRKYVKQPKNFLNVKKMQLLFVLFTISN